LSVKSAEHFAELFIPFFHDPVIFLADVLAVERKFDPQLRFIAGPNRIKKMSFENALVMPL